MGLTTAMEPSASALQFVVVSRLFIERGEIRLQPVKAWNGETYGLKSILDPSFSAWRANGRW